MNKEQKSLDEDKLLESQQDMKELFEFMKKEREEILKLNKSMRDKIKKLELFR